jgi:cbb3-type cytochrome oxidase maturation protein
MSVLIILIPVSVLLVGVAIWAFFWAVDSGQFDDLDSPALDILRDDSAPCQESSKKGDLQ